MTLRSQKPPPQENVVYMDVNDMDDMDKNNNKDNDKNNALG